MSHLLLRAESQVGPVVAEALGHDKMKWQEFRSMCGSYLNGSCSADQYFTRLSMLIPKTGTELEKLLKLTVDVFPAIKVCCIHFQLAYYVLA